MSHPRKKGAIGALAIGAYVPIVARKSIEAHGFPNVAVLSDWPEIIGEEFAQFTTPERLVWPRNPDTEASGTGRRHQRTGATLVLRVDGPRALEIQHMSQQIIERVNIYFGYGAVCTLRLLQGPVRRSPENRPKKRVPPQPKPDDDHAIGIEDAPLRSALARLGAYQTRNKP